VREEIVDLAAQVNEPRRTTCRNPQKPETTTFAILSPEWRNKRGS
jgi:hypothetical protein